MAEFNTKFNIGDEVYFIDNGARAPTGPARITEIFVSIVPGKTAIRYHFSGAVSRREDSVFATHEQALSACRDPNYFLAEMRS